MPLGRASDDDWPALDPADAAPVALEATAPGAPGFPLGDSVAFGPGAVGSDAVAVGECVA
ncbi:hypothetical protein BRD01_07005 [Halobacteriales archaeon QS_8_65_32]|nr:MAG: hypothetical protein BRD01_07005 [Halobacteriales archaeon QS_8_65_32]